MTEQGFEPTLRMETRRLILRPFEQADAQAAFTWLGDAQVMRFVPSGPDRTIEQTAARLDVYRAHQAAHGYSKWILIERASSRPVGDSGLLRLEEYGWIDLGFRLAPQFWGQGLATEAGVAWVHAAFAVHHLERLGAFTHPDNQASIHVLETLGFRAQRRAIVMGMNAVIFGLTASAVPA